MDCIFCKIRKGEIPSEKVYEDDMMMIIKDIDPKAEKALSLHTEKPFQTAFGNDGGGRKSACALF